MALRIILAKVFIVQGGDDSLSGPCRRNNQVSISTVDFSFCLETVENFLLVRERSDFK